MSARPYVVRQASPTLDGSEEMLCFVCDPRTHLRLRAPAAFAHVFAALEASVTARDDIRGFVFANSGLEIADDDLDLCVGLYESLDAPSPDRDLGAQLAAIHRVQDRRKKARVLRQLPDIVATVPFYAGYEASPADFSSLPLIGKPQLREQLQQLHVPHDRARYIWTTSSGTTGERVQAPHLAHAYRDFPLRSLAVADPTLDSDSRGVTFMPAECGGMACNMDPDSPMRERILGTLLLAPQLGNPSVASPALLDRCAREIAEWQPAVITGAPSFLYAFARHAESVGLRLPGLRAIFYHVEPASRLHTRRIEAVFGIRGRSVYIVSELGWPSVEWLPGRLFAAPTHIVELLRDGRPAEPGEIGHVVVTRVAHGSAILLRYDTRDLARLNADGVSMSRVLGRSNTGLVRCADGRLVASDELDAAVTDAGGDAIAFYRLFRRGTPARFTFDWSASGEGDPGRASHALAESVRELLGAAVEVRKVSGIPPHRGGRMPLFLDEGD